MYVYILVYIIINLINYVKSQEIPTEFIENEVLEYSFNLGKNWDRNTTLGLNRYSYTDKFNNINFSIINSRIGIHTINGSIAIFGYGNFQYNNFYCFIYPRIVNDVTAFARYSGIQREIDRTGFISGETDLSGIGYENEWLMVQWGRGREEWSSGEGISLALSNNSSAYDYGALKLSFNSVRVKYLHGFLESLENGVNRYITARGIEYTNKESLIFGFSEVVIYSGENRPFDIGYMNPISTHLEIELNDRLNKIGYNHANAVWQASLDWMANNKVRVSGNILFDEFVIDDIQKNAGKEHGLAYSARVSYSPVHSENVSISAYVQHIKVGTSTFRHGNGTNNFVIREKPLGWHHGSDGLESMIGIKVNYKDSMLADINMGQRETGDESILSNPYIPYIDYLSGPFPSGNVEKNIFLFSTFKWHWKPWVRFESRTDWSKDDGLEISAGVFLFLPKMFVIK